jgi:L-alanine-DL-glutamate epimerase-like enolase superfamily enzyme
MLVDQKLSPMRLTSFRITRFQFARDRVIGDSQVRADDVNCGALELVTDDGRVGLGFFQTLFQNLPDQAEIERVFQSEVWPGLEGKHPAGLVHQVTRPRGGNRRGFTLPFHEAVQVALWDLAAKAVDMPLYKLLGANRNRVRAYASGLDFHLTDDEFAAFFAHADSIGYSAFKIKVGHPDFEWDLNRLNILQRSVRKGAQFMIDTNEGWGAKEALNKLSIIHRAGYEVLWSEDPILRDDLPGLKMLCDEVSWTMINSGEYLDARGKRLLMEAGGTDILNVHGQVTDVMRIGWLAADRGVPVTLGNTFLEVGVHMACALPEVEWLEYSFQNFDHLVDEPMLIKDGYIYAPDRPGHGLVLSETARRDWSRPTLISHDALGAAPANPRTASEPKLAANRR